MSLEDYVFFVDPYVHDYLIHCEHKIPARFSDIRFFDGNITIIPHNRLAKQVKGNFGMKVLRHSEQKVSDLLLLQDKSK